MAKAVLMQTAPGSIPECPTTSTGSRPSRLKIRSRGARARTWPAPTATLFVHPMASAFRRTESVTGLKGIVLYQRTKIASVSGLYFMAKNVNTYLV